MILLYQKITSNSYNFGKNNIEILLRFLISFVYQSEMRTGKNLYQTIYQKNYTKKLYKTIFSKLLFQKFSRNCSSYFPVIFSISYIQ